MMNVTMEPSHFLRALPLASVDLLSEWKPAQTAQAPVNFIC